MYLSIRTMIFWISSVVLVKPDTWLRANRDNRVSSTSGSTLLFSTFSLMAFVLKSAGKPPKRDYQHILICLSHRSYERRAQRSILFPNWPDGWAIPRISPHSQSHFGVDAACRSLHNSQPFQLAEQQQPVPASPAYTEPVTKQANRGSLQLSLETPQNKAGVFPP